MELEYCTPDDLNAVVPITYWVEDEDTLDKVFHDLVIYAPEFFFRGLRRSSYRLLNTWQRHVLEHPGALDGFRDVDHYWGKRLHDLQMDADAEYNKQLAEACIESSDDLARLSYLQHHGKHTPFLDFTEDPFIAMCFAAQEPNTKEGATVPLDQWFCIHAMPRSLVKVFNGRYGEAIERNRSRSDLIVGRTYSKYMFFSEGEFLLMYRPWLIENLGEPYGCIMNNVFIQRQKGLFLFHKHPRKPFIEALLDYQCRMELTRRHGTRPSDRLICINFRRGLAESVRRRLIGMSLSYSYDFLMPSFN